nr:bifunctional hydroxymethylpyrimidine kinase/phosphomethylpyrimidine kinase [Maliibacterium massiliense]
MFKALTIAGTDPTGGAGVQADLKTFAAHKVFGMSVITAVLAQNTCGVQAVENISTQMVRAQMDAVFTDIMPDAVKIGMVSNVPIIDTIICALEDYKPRPIVLDTVMVSTSRHRLLEAEAEQHLIAHLIPRADIITPNIPEAEVLCGFAITSEQDMLRAAEAIACYFDGYIMIKGGHFADGCNDLLYRAGSAHWLRGSFVATKNTHGTGCTLSSAIAANLACGKPMLDAVAQAKAYVAGALAAGLDLGRGNGPLDHTYALEITRA